jgi:hypothetical protein
MALTKRIDGDYNIQSIGATDDVNITTRTVTINGNLDVNGTTTTIDSTDLTVADHVIHLNQGESGAGISGSESWGAEIPVGAVASSGIRIKRGTENDVGIRYNEVADKWQITNDGIIWANIVSTLGTVLTDLHSDLSPALGQNLDVNGWKIVSNTGEDTNSNGTTDTLDITIAPVANGEFRVNSDATTGSGISVQDQTSNPAAVAGYNKVYAKTPATGGSGLFFTNTTQTDELVSKTKAIVFGIIF